MYVFIWIALVNVGETPAKTIFIQIMCEYRDQSDDKLSTQFLSFYQISLAKHSFQY